MTMFKDILMLFCFYFRQYIQDPWCREEFLVAHRHMKYDKTKHLMPILVDNIPTKHLTTEMKLYIKTGLYIDARKNFDFNKLLNLMA